MKHPIRIKGPERAKLRKCVLTLTQIASYVRDLESKDKIERAAALIIQVLITARFYPNQRDLYDE